MIASDGSDTSKRAAKIGLDIAARANGRVTAIYVMDTARLSHLPGYASLPGLKDKILELMREEGREALGFIEERAGTLKVPFEGIVREGRPGEMLLKAANESRVDLIVMGSRGRSKMEKFLLGSVAENVVLRSMIPVLLVKDDEERL